MRVSETETPASKLEPDDKVKMSEAEIMAIFGAKPAIKVAKPPEVRAPANLITTKSQELEMESRSPEPPRKTVKTLLPVLKPTETTGTEPPRKTVKTLLPVSKPALINVPEPPRKTLETLHPVSKPETSVTE